jgi:glutaredoxin 3
MKKVTVYSTTVCPYCVNAKELLNSQGIAYEEILVDKDPVKRAEMEQLSGRRTVPQIFIGEQSVGGFSDLKKLYEEGELFRLLEH